jgi:hypothetical protein
MHALLNRGESVHQLQSAIYTGKLPPERGLRRGEMIAISGSLTALMKIASYRAGTLTSLGSPAHESDQCM